MTMKGSVLAAKEALVSAQAASGDRSPNEWIFDWPADLAATPSRADGVLLEQELYERAQGVDLIVRVGSVRISVPLLTVATATIYLQRFYMLESVKKYRPREVAMACLFMAGKVEESLRKVEAVVNYCLRLEERRKGREPKIHPTDPDFRKLVQQVLYIEEIILVTLQFDMTVEHPHPLIIEALASAVLTQNLMKDQLDSLGRCAWQILADIYTHAICVCYSPPVLAAASLLLGWHALDPLTALSGEKFPTQLSDLTNLFPAIDWTDSEEAGEIDEVVDVMCEWWGKAKNTLYTESSERVRKHVPKLAGVVQRQLLHEGHNGTDVHMLVDMQSPLEEDHAFSQPSPAGVAKPP